jgi:hypothetical protein
LVVPMVHLRGLRFRSAAVQIKEKTRIPCRDPQKVSR